jgi:serine/threonine-protein kinase PRP4
MNTHPPSAKRPRLLEMAEDDDLSGFIDGDDFVSEAQKQEKEAQRRRQQRKERLRHLQPDDEPSSLSAQNVEATSKKKTIVLSPADELSVENSDGMTAAKSSAKKEKEEFDMFSSSVSPMLEKQDNRATPGASMSRNNNSKRGHEQEDWDDAEGYYKAVIGETICLVVSSSSSSDPTITLRVFGVVGKGVFSTVLKCSVLSNSSSIELPVTVALKCIRHNETMAKAALNELQILRQLNGSPGIVPLLLPTGPIPILEHRGHVVLAFAFMEYNLRDVLQKFGKGVGISLQAVRSYFGQLLAAATHLQKHGIIHADIKPDNILVSADFGVVQLADFGSAIQVASPQQSVITPYLVSRYYRAPEIILGLTLTHAADLWSLAVTVAEIFLGNLFFVGKSNNDMLYVFMQHLGAFSNRVIRQHLVVCQRLPIPRHFEQEGASYVFRQQTVDPVDGSAVHKFLSLQPRSITKTEGVSSFICSTPLKAKLLKAKSANDSKKSVLDFADLLQNCLSLDPTRRIALKDALQHSFFHTAAPTHTD